MEKMYEVGFEQLPDGTISLEQQSGLDDPSVIHLHPEQLRFIARRMAGMKPETAERAQDLERKLQVLADRISDFVCEDSIRLEIGKDCANGFEFILRMDAIDDLAIEFTRGLTPVAPVTKSVTPVTETVTPTVTETVTPTVVESTTPVVETTTPHAGQSSASPRPQLALEPTS